jgi:hypothetical protein
MRISALASLGALAPVACAQNFNIDFCTGADSPPGFYGAAANRPGLWETDYRDPDTLEPKFLTDIDGVLTRVMMTPTLPYGCGVADNVDTTGDVATLLDDYLVLRQGGGTWEVSGLAPGRYTLYLYGWAPDQDYFRTFFAVNGVDAPNGLGGVWPGSLVENVTHAVLHATVRQGQNLIIQNGGLFSGTFNGLQIITSGQCPADFSGSTDPNSTAYGLGDGFVDATDFFYYLDQFVAGNLDVADLTASADPNHFGYGVPNGTIDSDDFFYYLDLFVTGCF